VKTGEGKTNYRNRFTPTPDQVKNKPVIEVVICSSQKAGRAAWPGEVILDETDGLDWPTLCKCDLIYNLEKTELKQKRGEVAHARRNQIIRTIRAAHAWAGPLTS